MSAINFKALTPSGIFSLDRAISMVLASFERFDKPETTWKFIRLLATTTADIDIIKECQKHSKETAHELALKKANRGFTHADSFSLVEIQSQYIDERNESLYALIMELLAKKGFSQRAGLLGTSSFKELEKEESAIQEGEDNSIEN
jgi:hypothetical protein